MEFERQRVCVYIGKHALHTHAILCAMENTIYNVQSQRSTDIILTKLVKNLVLIDSYYSQMLTKYPKKSFLNIRRGVRFFIIAEGAIFLGSYMLFAACNRSQNTRQFFHDRFYLRFIINFYYTTAELCGNNQVRGFDQATWEAKRQLLNQQP